jgi:hypothetical protein
MHLCVVAQAWLTADLARPFGPDAVVELHGIGRLTWRERLERLTVQGAKRASIA